MAALQDEMAYYLGSDAVQHSRASSSGSLPSSGTFPPAQSKRRKTSLQLRFKTVPLGSRVLCYDKDEAVMRLSLLIEEFMHKRGRDPNEGELAGLLSGHVTP